VGQKWLGGMNFEVFLDIQTSGDKIKHEEIGEVPNINSLSGKAGK
jgi:hypothetical protein